MAISVGGGGKTVSYLLAAFFAFAAAQTAQAAYQAWVGSSSSPYYWDDKANWNYNNSGWKSSWDFPQNGCYWNINNSLRTFNSTWNNSRTITFRTFDSSNVGNAVRIDAAASDKPIIFVSSDETESYGYNGNKNLVLSEYTDADAYLEIQSGKYVFGAISLGNKGSKTGSLKITGGAFQGSTIAVGNTSSAVGLLTVAGSSAKATATATGKISLNNGTVSVKSGGKLNCQTWFAVGSLANKTGTLEIDGGEVETTANCMTIGDVDGATGIVKIKNGGKYSNTGSSTIGLTVGQQETGALEVDGGEVELGTRTLDLCDNASATATVTVKNDGIIKMKGVQYGTGTGGATITIDGGVLKATEDNVNFIPAHDSLNVYVGSNGATFDTDGHVITIGENLKDVSGKTGSVRFVGGGVATLSAAGEYTGVTTVEVGTTVHVPSPAGIGGGLAVSVPAETPATGTYSLLVCDGEGAFTAAVLDGVAAPAGATLSVSQDGKTVLCTYGDGGPVWIGGTSGSLSDAANWGNNAVPGAGTNCVIGVSGAATLTVGDSFAASSITFPADSAAVTINAAAGESITGIVAITNLSLTTSHTINAPVHFAGDIQVNQAAMAETGDLTKAHVTFAGGAYAAEGYALESGDFSAVYSRCIFGDYYLYPSAGSPWTASYQGSQKRLCLADNSVLHIPYAGDLTELYIGTGAAVTNGVVNLPEGKRLCYRNFGEYVIADEFTVSGSSKKDGYAGFSAGTGAANVFKIEKATCNKTDGYTFYFAEGNSASHGTYYFGKGGINFGSGKGYFGIGKNSDNDAQTIRPWYGDFTIEAGSGNSAGWDMYFFRSVTFNTDDENGIGRTITLNARPRFNYTPTFTVSGTGKVLVNGLASNSVQPPVTVTDTATLEYAAGASLGTGPLTLGTGTTFVVASADLPINVASFTLPGSGKATIQITGDTAYLDGDYEVLFSAAGLPAGFADKINIVLPDGTSGNRRLYTTDNGTMRLIVGSGDVPDPYTWTGAANDGKMNTAGNWRGNAVPPTDATVFIPSMAGTLDNDIENFAPSSITFGYGTDTVTISGNAITGVAAITNLSTTASHTINAPVAFADKILVVQGAMSWEQKSNPSIHFAGGVTGTTFADGTARYLKGAFYLSTGADWVANTQGGNTRWGLPAGSSLTLPSATDTCELALGDSSTSGGAFTTGVMRTSARLLCWNYGEYVVTNEFTATFPAGVVHYCGYENISNGKYKFEKMTLEGTYNSPFKFGNAGNAADTGTQQFYIGKGGLCFADGASQNLRYETGGAKNDATVRLDPWHGDYTIHTKRASNPTDFTVSAKTYFGTTDEDGNACMVTDEGVINSYGSAADINIDGNGQFVVNAVCAATCPVTVTNTATLAINAGKKLTTGATTVNDGATLEVAESGTVTLGGALTLKAGAKLGFNYTNRNEPKLDLSGKTVTFDEGETTNVVVKISADAGKHAKGGANVLTSGGKFTGVAVSLDETNKPDWAMGVSVNGNGEIVLNVKPIGTMFLVR